MKCPGSGRALINTGLQLVLSATSDLWGAGGECYHLEIHVPATGSRSLTLSALRTRGGALTCYGVWL